MLRVSFPTSIVTDHATCEIQFGHLDRPTHHNTSWDEAKFEVCAQRWVDMTDAAGGAALLADCKYGYKVWDNVLDLCLLRSQNCPAEHGDIGEHAFTYALLPHDGDAYDGGVIAEGYRLTYPLPHLSAVGAGGETALCPFRVTAGTAVLETVKKAEDSDQLVLRLYEAKGGATTARLALAGYAPAAICNLLEEPTGEAYTWENGELVLPFHPIEIKSILVQRS